MLIQKIIGAPCAALFHHAFRFGPAESSSIGSGFLLRLPSSGALFELPEIDQFPHADPHHLMFRQMGWLRTLWRPPAIRRNPAAG
jgi:hypothetical protein